MANSQYQGDSMDIKKDARSTLLQRLANNQETFTPRHDFKTAKVPVDSKTHYYIVLPQVNGDLAIQANYHFNFYYRNAKGKRVSVPCPNGTRLHLPDDTNAGKCPICEEYFKLREQADNTPNERERKALVDAYEDMRSTNVFEMYAIMVDVNDLDREYSIDQVKILKLPYSHYVKLQEGLMQTPQELFDPSGINYLETQGIPVDVELAYYMDTATAREDRRYFLWSSERPELQKYGNGRWTPSFVEGKYLLEELLKALNPLKDWYLNFHKLPDSDDPMDVFDYDTIYRSLLAYQLEKAGEGDWDSCYDDAASLVDDKESARRVAVEATKTANMSREAKSGGITKVDVADKEEEASSDDTEETTEETVDTSEEPKTKVQTLAERIRARKAKQPKV